MDLPARAVPIAPPRQGLGKGCAVATSGNWAFNAALGLFTPVALANIKWRTYIIFGVFNTAAFFHILFLFPETAGKTLEETESMFEDPNGIKYIGTPAWKTKKATAAITRAEHGDFDLESKMAEHGGEKRHVEATQ